jgi:hypothetical protein
LIGVRSKSPQAMMGLGKLEAVEVGSFDEDRPIVADLSFFSVCSASLVLPLVASVLLIFASFFIPRPFSEIATSHTIEPSRTGGFAFEAELSNLTPRIRSISLTINFSQALTSPCRILLSFAQYSDSASDPYRIQSTENQATHATVPLFKSYFVNASKLKFTISVPTIPTASTVTARWSIASVSAFNFLAAVKVTLALLTIPAVTAVRAQVRTEAFAALRPQQQYSFAFLYFSLLTHIPLTSFLGDSVAYIVEDIICDIGFAALAFHAVLMLLPFIMSDGSYGFWGIGPPGCLFAFTAALSVYSQIGRPPVHFFPPIEGGIPTYVFFSAAGAALLFCG